MQDLIFVGDSAMPDINFAALDRFSYKTYEDANTIANLDTESATRIRSAGTYEGALSALRRTDEEKADNNAIRTELLKSLGQAFHIEGMQERSDGKVTFNSQFMDRLGKLFGADLKQGDFGIAADGSVASGKPLTQRRITAILNKAASYVDSSQKFSSYVYAGKTSAFIAEFNKLGGQTTEAGKKLAKTIEVASKMLCILDKPSDKDPNLKNTLLQENFWYSPETAELVSSNRHWGVNYVSQGDLHSLEYVNNDQQMKDVLRENGLDIDLGLAPFSEGNTSQEAIDAINSDFQSKLQNFVKTACDAWGKVQQGQIPVDRFLEAFNADSGQGQNLAAFLNNMQSLEAAG